MIVNTSTISTSVLSLILKLIRNHNYHICEISPKSKQEVPGPHIVHRNHLAMPSLTEKLHKINVDKALNRIKPVGFERNESEMTMSKKTTLTF